MNKTRTLYTTLLLLDIAFQSVMLTGARWPDRFAQAILIDSGYNVETVGPVILLQLHFNSV